MVKLGINPFKSSSTLPRHQQKILRDQTIDENGPGTILRDFNVLLHFVADREPPASPGLGTLNQKFLEDLNGSLSCPIRLGLQRPRQKSYPHIDGLWLLARTMGLAIVKRAGGKRLLAVDEQILESWKQLNPTERFFTLLEAWLLKDKPEIVGEPRRGFRQSVDECLEFVDRIPPQGLPISGNREVEKYITHFPGLRNLALLELFGLLAVEHDVPPEGMGWQIRLVRAREFGYALLKLAHEASLETMRDDDLSPDFGAWQPFFKPYFSEWRNLLAPPRASFMDGTFNFKVTLCSGIWRRIAIDAHFDLDSLSYSILRAFEFDNDHLYQFIYKNRLGMTERIVCPDCDGSPSTPEIQIGDLPLEPGDSMVFHFDFGDDWRFQVKLEKIEPAKRRLKSPQLLDSHGEAPEQYPSME